MNINNEAECICYGTEGKYHHGKCPKVNPQNKERRMNMETLGECFYSMTERNNIDMDNYPPWLILDVFKMWTDGEDWKQMLSEYDKPKEGK